MLPRMWIEPFFFLLNSDDIAIAKLPVSAAKIWLSLHHQSYHFTMARILIASTILLPSTSKLPLSEETSSLMSKEYSNLISNLQVLGNCSLSYHNHTGTIRPFFTLLQILTLLLNFSNFNCLSCSHHLSPISFIHKPLHFLLLPLQKKIPWRSI